MVDHAIVPNDDLANSIAVELRYHAA